MTTDKPSLLLVVPGIETRPDSVFEWTDDFEDLVNVSDRLRPNVTVKRYEYAVRWYSRRFSQQEHADALVSILGRYDDWPTTIVAHSNGCDLVLRALAEIGRPIHPITLHLISPAAEASFERNGLNRLCKLGFVRSVTVYIAGEDKAMRWARWSQRLFGWFGWGYGTLGLHGPTGIAEDFPVNVYHERVEPGYGHSDWFTGSNLMRTFNCVSSGL